MGNTLRHLLDARPMPSGTTETPDLAAIPYFFFIWRPRHADT
jgi:hypothetical protein